MFYFFFLSLSFFRQLFINHIIKLSMLEKYEDFFKISRNEECNIYTGISRETGQHVLLKRHKKSKNSWDEVLKSRSLQFTQKSKMFPKMVEIFKNKADYYVVFDKPTGPNLANADLFGPLSLQNFYPLLADLCLFLKQLRQFNPMAWVLPQWIFVHRNSVKFLHFQPFFINRDMQSSDHVYLYKVDNNMTSSSRNDNESEGSAMPADKKRNLIFNLGCICFYLLTGSKKPELASEDQYLNYFGELQLHAEKRIVKMTKDKNLAQMVGKMLSSNVFELPDLDRIINYFTGKAAEMTPKKKGHSTNIEIQLEKITLETSRPVEEVDMRRRLRPCCAEKQASLEKINEENKQMREKKDTDRKNLLLNLRESSTGREGSLPKRPPFLPSIHKKGHGRMKTSIDLMNTTNSKPLMFANRSSIMKCN